MTTILQGPLICRSLGGPFARPLDRCTRLLMAGAVTLAGFMAPLSSAEAAAQVPDKAAADVAADIPVKPATGEPQLLELATRDRVVIHCVYHPGTRGESTVPVILLHGWEGPRGAGSGQDVAALAIRLQKAGHAVAVPDLRGHGRSTRRQLGEGRFETIDREKLRPAELRSMILDVEAVRSFLVGENNAKRVNLEQLCVIGFEMGSIVALNWILYDWSVPSLPTLKQGQDVKAFVLVSPDQSFKGMDARRALAHPVVSGRLSAMMIYGKGDPENVTAKRLHNTFRRAHRAVAAESAGLQDLFVVELDTRLRGTKLLGSEALAVTDYIEQFIQRRLVDRAAAFPWRDRSRP